MRLILTSDLHLTDKARDQYRWGLFPWLHKQINEYRPEAIFIAGDITDSKDKHSAVLTNRMADEFVSLATKCPVYILKGNHDCIDDNNPFFGFLDLCSDDLYFVKEPQQVVIKASDATIKTLMLPHTKDMPGMLEEWGPHLKKYEYILLHHTFDRAVSSNGFKLDGDDSKILKPYKGKVFSGDIHVPQQLGPVCYVGAPYHIKFGDTYNPRVLLLNTEDHSKEDLYYPCLSKHTVTVADVESFKKSAVTFSGGDQVKVELQLTPATRGEFNDMKKRISTYCEEMGFDLWDVQVSILDKAAQGKDRTDKVEHLTDDQVFERWGQKETLEPEILAYGKELLNEI